MHPVFGVAIVFLGALVGNHCTRVTLINSIVFGVISYGQKQRDMLMMGLILLYLLDGKNVFGKNEIDIFSTAVSHVPSFAHTKSDCWHMCY